MDNLINTISVKGARQHNLKNVSLDIPKNKLVVLTGVSGSGKSSFAFDTLYAEGQRRYVESLSTYARQFLGIMEKPDVDSITGLSPSISIDQKTTSRNPRSTVGTVTEIYDYLRLLFARVGHPHCPVCGQEIQQQTLDQIVGKSLDLIESAFKKDKKAWYYVLAPVVKDRKGEFSSLFDNLKSKGYTKVRVDGHIKDLDEDFVLLKTNKHTIEVVVDRVAGGIEIKSRLTESIQQSLNLADGYVILSRILDKGFEMPEKPKEFEDHLFSEKFSCPNDNVSLPEIEPRSFSFNSPHGACPTCTGLGKLKKVEPNLVFSEDLSIMEGGILPFSSMFDHETWYAKTVIAMCEVNKINTHIPIKKLTQKEKDILLFGTKDKDYQVEGTNKWGRPTKIWQKYEGIVNSIERRYKETDSDYIKGEFEKYMKDTVCETCDGTRLKKEALSVTINSENIAQVTHRSITKMGQWVKELNEKLNSKEKEIGNLIIKEIEGRLAFLSSVGLEYLSLDRVAGTLSGGEAQRIRLASQIGSGLTGVLYVLDEPTIGLHQKDNQKLIDTLKHLRDLGNSVVVVEHDEEMMRQSDYLADFGPGAGKLGGKIVSSGTPSEVMKDTNSLTGAYLSGRKRISDINIPKLKQDSLEKKELVIFGASQFNLKNIDVTFPLGNLICITGVSGSGKSTLLVETLYPALQREFNTFFKGDVGSHKRIEGADNIDKVILIDQSPIGRTPRSNPATYTGLFDPIRDLFASTREAKLRGFKKGQFSFNLKGGRCEACEGQGQTKIEMQFMPDIWISCEVCHGKRYNSQTLEVTYKGKNISEVLDLTITDALDFFASISTLREKLETLQDVGLGYMQLGQAATTLSGGEAQRVKLATELSRRQTGKTFYILDEPTTGLHFADVEKLLKVLKILVSKGNTVCVIEHNLDIIKNSDHIIDLGPEGGDKGGEIVAIGTPKEIKQNKNSVTGKYL